MYIHIQNTKIYIWPNNARLPNKAQGKLQVWDESHYTLSCILSWPNVVKKSIQLIKLVLCSRAIHITSKFGYKWEERISNRERGRERDRRRDDVGREEKGRGQVKVKGFWKTQGAAEDWKFVSIIKNNSFENITSLHNHITHHLVNAFNAHIKQKRMWVDKYVQICIPLETTCSELRNAHFIWKRMRVCCVDA